MSRIQIQKGNVPGAPRLAYDWIGSGPLVVFLHGIGGNRSNWTRQLECIAPSFCALAWDARGYGGSEDYSDPLDFGDFSADLLRLLDHRKAPRAHLVGLSMGGRIALDFYERHPERVASLVLCDTSPGFQTTMTPAQRDAYLRSRQEPLLAGAEPRDIAPEVAKTLAGPTAPPPVIQQLIESMAALRKASYLKTLETMLRYERVAALGKVTVPTQLIVGSCDALTPPALSRSMAREIPDARLAILEGAGHVSNLERPRDFNRVLLDFLRAVRER